MQHGKYRFIAGFLVTPLALYAVFVIWPFIQSIYYSFTDWTGLSPDFKMVGFANYKRMFEDDVFWKSLQHSVLLALLLPLVTLGLALFFAFMLNVGGRRRKASPSPAFAVLVSTRSRISSRRCFRSRSSRFSSGSPSTPMTA